MEDIIDDGAEDVIGISGNSSSGLSIKGEVGGATGHCDSLLLRVDS